MPEGAFDVILKMAATAGPFGSLIMMVVAYLLWKSLQRKDEQLMQVTRGSIEVLGKTAAALDSVRDEIRRGRRRGRR